jgi:hypothetical protein
MRRYRKTFSASTIAAAALALMLSSVATLTAASRVADERTGSGAWSSVLPGGGGQARFVDKHGLVLKTAQVYLLYWGSAWLPQAAPTPSADRVTNAVRTMMASIYMTGLAQYRGIGRAVVRGSAVLTSSEPPAGFTDEQVGRFVDDQLTAGTVRGPDADNQTLYAVVVPAGVEPGSADWDGEHNYQERSGQRIHYAWVANSGDLPGVTQLISHELVESVTDPEGEGILGVKGACSGSGWCEIADVCGSTAVLDGITVQSYWSNQAGACVVPVASSELAGSSPDEATPVRRNHGRAPRDHIVPRSRRD